MRVRGFAAVFTVFVLATSMLVVPGLNAVQPAKGADVAEWRYLVYLVADNSLDVSAGQFHVPVVEDDFQELMSVDSSDLVQCYVFVDRFEGPANLFKFTKDNMEEITDFDLNGIEVNMGDPATLRAFIEYVYEAAPAERTMLMFWDHGSFDYAGWDDNGPEPGVGDALTHYDVMEALDGYKADVVGYDECLVGQMETVYEYALNGFQADYLMVSETYTGWRGYPYDQTLQELVENPYMDSRECALMFIEQTQLLLSQRPYMSEIVNCHAAIDMSKVRTLADSVGALAKLLTPDVKTYVKDISRARGVAGFSWGANAINVADLWTFVTTIDRFVDDVEISEACQQVLTNFDETVIALQVSHSMDHQVHGLGINLAFHERDVPDYYAEYSFDDNGWLDFLDAFWTACGI